MVRAGQIAAAAVLLCGFASLAGPMIGRSPYLYDEADYMYAAGRGLAANYLDSPSQSFPDFLRTGLSRGKDATQKAALSQSIRDSGDIDFYRHWHGPLYYYWLILLQPWKADEHTVRALGMIFPAATLLIICFGVPWLFPGEAGLSAGLLGAAAFGWSAATVSTAELAPHQLFVLLFIVGLLSLGKAVETGERKFWYGAVVCAALAMATLEVGLILVLTMAAAAYLWRRRLRTDWVLAAKSLALLSVTVVVVWPGALLRLAFLKAYIVMAYLAVARKSAWGASFGEAWSARFLLAPVEWFLLAAALWLWFGRKKQRDRRAAPFLIFSLLMLVFLAKVNAAGARYMLPFLPGFAVFAAVVVTGSTRRRNLVVTGAAALVLLNTIRIEQSRRSHPADTRPAELVSMIRAGDPRGKTIVIPHDDLPMLHYYFPETHFISYGEDGEGPPEGAAANAVVYEGYPTRVRWI